MRNPYALGGIIVAPLAVFALSASATCSRALPFHGRPAAGYTYGSALPLRVALIDETQDDDWQPALVAAVSAYAAATPHLQFQEDPQDANIVMRVRRYTDGEPPQLDGYVFEPGVGGFATVYDADGVACNFPPSTVPVRCSGEIAHAEIYLNDAIPPGTDIEARRERLILHELGHAMGLLRHSPDLDIPALDARYGWEDNAGVSAERALRRSVPW